MMNWLLSLFWRRKKGYPTGLLPRHKYYHVARRIIEEMESGQVFVQVAETRMNRVNRWADKREVWRDGPPRGEAVHQLIWDHASAKAMLARR